MMKMHVRRFASLLLIAALVLSLSVTALAAGTAPVSLTAPETVGAKGTVQVDVTADEANAVADGKLTVTYDAAVLSYVGAQTGTAWPEGSNVSLKVNSTQPGKLIVAFAGVYEANAGDVVNLCFTANQENTTAVVAMTGTVTGAGSVEASAETAVVCPSAKFTDLPDAWYHEGVDYVVANGIMAGISDTSFAPNGAATRSMMVATLYRLAGSPSVEGVENPFTDTPQDWYQNAIKWAIANGITSGTSATTFDPNGFMTREQMAAFLYRYAALAGANVDVKGDLSAFVDGSDVSFWAVDAMSWAVASGLINGMPGGRLVPKGICTRAQLAVVLANLDQKVLN